MSSVGLTRHLGQQSHRQNRARLRASARKAFASLVPQRYVFQQAFVMKKTFWLVGALALLLAGCASAPKHSFSRPFTFRQDTFAYANELVWEYQFDDATGKTSHRQREPEPKYTHHCFVVARAAKQFFQNARFDPSLSRVDAEAYRELIRRVIGVSPRKVLPEARRIVIPGYTNLFDFSSAWEDVLQAE